MISLCIIKPDAVRRSLTGVLLASIEAADFKIAALEQRKLTSSEVQVLYAHHAGTDYFQRIHDSMVEGPVVLAVISGVGFREHAIRLRNRFKGPSKNPSENVIHASDSAGAALDEIRLFFPGYRNEDQSPRSEHGLRDSVSDCGHPVLSI